MRDLLLGGEFNVNHLIEMMLMKEYAFAIEWKDFKEVRVVFSQGVWSISKTIGCIIISSISVTDCPDVSECSDPMAEGLMKTLIDKEVGSCKDIFRFAPARAMREFISIWGGKLEEIIRIDVRQPGRNSGLSKNAEFLLSPRKEDWLK